MTYWWLFCPHLSKINFVLIQGGFSPKSATVKYLGNANDVSIRSAGQYFAVKTDRQVRLVQDTMPDLRKIEQGFERYTDF